MIRKNKLASGITLAFASLVLASCASQPPKPSGPETTSHASGLSSQSASASGLSTSEESHASGLSSSEESHASGLSSSEESHASGLSSSESIPATGFVVNQNGTPIDVANVKPEGSTDKAVFKVTLAINDTVSIYNDGAPLHFYSGEGQDDGELYTALIAGEHTFYVNKDSQIWTVAPQPEPGPGPTPSGETVAYTITAMPNWIANDGATVFAWSWGGGIADAWVQVVLGPQGNGGADAKELSGTVELPAGRTGFNLARCVAGTTTPDWTAKGNADGRVYNKTGDVTITAGTTSYESPNWVEYNPQ